MTLHDAIASWQELIQTLEREYARICELIPAPHKAERIYTPPDDEEWNQSVAELVMQKERLEIHIEALKGMLGEYVKVSMARDYLDSRFSELSWKN